MFSQIEAQLCMNKTACNWPSLGTFRVLISDASSIASNTIYIAHNCISKQSVAVVLPIKWQGRSRGGVVGWGVGFQTRTRRE